ncbi:tRNA (adenine(37)-N6)-methyltransferase-like [Montipora capricornis]|uniref:tRNA (adenine(37)-N6)-methyltransferase-like n=1 Tax=Montipora capricornis TaxID=246305 RepID=UPI0035F1DB4A
MAEESALKILEWKVSVARKELNNLRRDVNSLKRMFIQKITEVKESLERGENRSVTLPAISKKQAYCKRNIQQSDKNCSALGLEIKPIGFIESCFKEKNGIPRQPGICPTAKATLCINVEGFTNPEHSLFGLDKFSHVWVIFHFHKNTNKAIKAKVKPPRLDGAKVGVFASRSPHRPNPIGLTLAKLDGIVGSTLSLSGIDLLDGTPVLDIKPYVPGYDEAPGGYGRELLDFDISKNRFENVALSKHQENGYERSLANPADVQLVKQSSDSGSQEYLEVKARLSDTAIAEWIQKPPIRELNVKFSSEALGQIGFFHGNIQDREVDEISGKQCSCRLSEERVSKVPLGGDSGEDIITSGKICVPEASTCGTFLSNSKMLKNGYDEGEKGTVAVTSKMSADVKPLKFHLLDLNASVGRESPLEGENGRWAVKEERCLGLSYDNELHTSSCVYQLKMLSSPDEAKRAITDILKADPRSVYRRNHCQDQFYRFSIDTINVTCKFEDATVEVLQIEPVYYRKLKDKPNDND